MHTFSMLDEVIPHNSNICRFCFPTPTKKVVVKTTPCEFVVVSSCLDMYSFEDFKTNLGLNFV